MNTLILTKIAKFILIGSFSALFAFVGRFNPLVRVVSLCLYGGIVSIIIIALLWEGRERFTAQLPEETLTSLIPNLTATSQSRKRNYLLSANARLELVIAVVVVTVFSLIGAL